MVKHYKFRCGYSKDCHFMTNSYQRYWQHVAAYHKKASERRRKQYLEYLKNNVWDTPIIINPKI